ncbi:MAG: DNA polymerase III subunit beta [Paludibacteraceae bacterium]|nr:DNA polymerase III subunit beta [Paludibacteraceae bacterium]
MKFSVSASALFERMQVLSKLFQPKPSISVFSCFLFDLKGNVLKMTVSDGESDLISEIEVDNQGGNDGRVAIIGKKLMEMVRAYGDQPLSFNIDEKTFAIKLETLSGESSLVGQTADEFPEFRELDEDVVTFDVEGKVMLEGISHTAFAAPNDELRPMMSSVFFDLKPDGMTLVATDSHRLARYTVSTIQCPEQRSVAFPLKSIQIVKTLFAAADDVMKISFDSNYIVCKTSLYLFKCRQVNGKYPPYEKVIPALPLPISLVVDRKALLSALHCVMVCADASSLVKLNIEPNKMKLSTQDIDYSVQAEERLSCQYDGDPLEIGFKAVMLDSILSALDCDEVVLHLTDKQRPGLFVPNNPKEGVDVLMLLMPMML